MNYYKVELYWRDVDENTSKPRYVYTFVSKQPEKLAIENILITIKRERCDRDAPLSTGIVIWDHEKKEGLLAKITNLNTKKVYREEIIWESEN